MIDWGRSHDWPRIELRYTTYHGYDLLRIIDVGPNSWWRFVVDSDVEELTACIARFGLPALPLCVDVGEIEHELPHPVLVKSDYRTKLAKDPLFRDELGFMWISYFDPDDHERCMCCGELLRGGWFPCDDLDEEEIPSDSIAQPSERIETISELCADCVCLRSHEQSVS